MPSGARDPDALFAARGLRCTKQRREVYAALRVTASHPTAEELFQAVRLADPGISLATIYNTLEALTRAGLCRRLASPHPAAGTGPGASRYDADMSDHAHLLTVDGRVADLPDDLGRAVLARIPREVVEEVERRFGVRVARLSVEFIEAGPHASV